MKTWGLCQCPRAPGAAGALWVVLSPGWLFTEGMTMARDLAGWELFLGLSGLLVEESESWESCTVTQLITFVLWLVPELQDRIREEWRNISGWFFHFQSSQSGYELTRQRGTSCRPRPLSRCGWWWCWRQDWECRRWRWAETGRQQK